MTFCRRPPSPVPRPGKPRRERLLPRTLPPHPVAAMPGAPNKEAGTSALRSPRSPRYQPSLSGCSLLSTILACIGRTSRALRILFSLEIHSSGRHLGTGSFLLFRGGRTPSETGDRAGTGDAWDPLLHLLAEPEVAVRLCRCRLPTVVGGQASGRQVKTAKPGSPSVPTCLGTGHEVRRPGGAGGQEQPVRGSQALLVHYLCPAVERLQGLK